MARLPKKYTGNFMADARQALHGVGMIVCNKNGQSAYPDKGLSQPSPKNFKMLPVLIVFFRAHRLQQYQQISESTTRRTS